MHRSGYASWIGDVAETDSVLVEILYELGAVPFVRTNVPQTLIVRHRSSCPSLRSSLTIQLELVRIRDD